MAFLTRKPPGAANEEPVRGYRIALTEVNDRPEGSGAVAAASGCRENPDQPPVSSRIRSAADRGSACLVMARPTTM